MHSFFLICYVVYVHVIGDDVRASYGQFWDKVKAQWDAEDEATRQHAMRRINAAEEKHVGRVQAATRKDDGNLVTYLMTVIMCDVYESGVYRSCS
jgi:hypothetical protein